MLFKDKWEWIIILSEMGQKLGGTERHRYQRVRVRTGFQNQQLFEALAK